MEEKKLHMTVLLSVVLVGILSVGIALLGSEQTGYAVKQTPKPFQPELKTGTMPEPKATPARLLQEPTPFEHTQKELQIQIRDRKVMPELQKPSPFGNVLPAEIETGKYLTTLKKTPKQEPTPFKIKGTESKIKVKQKNSFEMPSQKPKPFN